MKQRRRLDAELVRRELVDSRTIAQRMIAEHRVTVNGALVSKPASMVAPSDAVELLGPPNRWVGRGGDKLAHALERFSLDPRDRRCLDVGSSTGGFTDCLLQSGATQVVALDVGRAQLHERLRADGRVVVREQTDVRSVSADELGGRFDFVVVDVSFIALDRITAHLRALLTDDGDLVALIKPQFEAGRAEADKGRGVITDPEIWKRVLEHAIASAHECGLLLQALTVSPIKGGAGNVEFLGHFRAGLERFGDGVTTEGDIAAWIDGAIAAAHELA